MSSDANHIFYVFLGYASIILNTRIQYCFFSIGTCCFLEILMKFLSLQRVTHRKWVKASLAYLAVYNPLIVTREARKDQNAR